LPLAAAGIALAVGAGLWLQWKQYFWRNPVADARFQTVTDFGGVEQAAAASRDGNFVAFLSGRERIKHRHRCAGQQTGKDEVPGILSKLLPIWPAGQASFREAGLNGNLVSFN
jgi:hypothetical protein